MTFGTLAVFVLVMYNLTIASLQPNEFGLMRNVITGKVGGTAVRGGLHYTGLFTSLMRFPATQVTIEFAGQSRPSKGADRLAVQTRTGADPNDPDSGGQPIAISCAFQFQIQPELMRQVYLSFGSYEAARERWVLLSGNMVGNVAQQFTPQDFWVNRKHIADTMLRQVNETLWKHGNVYAMNLQIFQVDFAKKFEDSITAVQVAEQQKVVNEYEQQVATVVQSIEVLKAENEAAIANISASAEATGKKIMAQAHRDVFNLKQQMKAKKYSELQRALGFENRHMEQYFKIKSLQSQGSNGKLVVGIPSVEVDKRPEL